MRTSYQLYAQQTNIKLIQRKGAGKRFTFTQSSKILPKPHSLDEFGQIIENKKVYQSMIKDQIRKLQAMEACIVDPEIDPFIIPNDKYIPSLFSKQENKTNNKTQIIKKNSLDQVDKYLDHQLDKHKLNLLHKITKKANQKSFIKLLNRYHRYTRKMKAACFFNYDYICRKVFTKLKSISNLDSNTDISITNKQEKLKNLILTNNFDRYKTSIQDIKLQQRIKVYKKTKQFRTKKVNISRAIKKFKEIKELQINYSKLLILIKRNAIAWINKKYRHNKKIINSTQILNKVHIKKHIKIIFQKQRQHIFKKSQQIKNMLQKILKQRNKQIPSQQVQIKKYCKDLNLCAENQKLILTKFRQLLITKRNKQKLLQKSKIFFIERLRLLAKIKSVTKIYNEENTNLKNCKLFFTNIVQDWKYNNKYKQARAIRIRKCFDQFKINVETDRKLSESISYCLVGCKQWLINNKHIFKSQANHKSSASFHIKNNKNEQPINIYHPLLNKTKNDLLAQQSRFKKVVPIYNKKLFINKLRQLLKCKKQLQMMTYAADMVYKNRLITKIWRTFSNRQLIQQIKKQICQQVEAEADSQAAMKINEVQIMINKLKITSFYKNLQMDKQMKMKNSQLQQNLIQKKRRNILCNLKFILQRKQQKRNLEYKRKQYIKRIVSFSFTKLKRQLQSITHNKLKQREILSNYNKLQRQGSSLQIDNKNNKINVSQIIKKLRQKNSNKQFIDLLRMHWKIYKSSVTITSNYLRNKLIALKTFYKSKNQLNHIQVKKQQLINIIKKQYLVKFAKRYQFIFGINSKIQNLNCLIVGKYKIIFFNNLLNYTNTSKKQQTKQNIRKLKSLLQKRIFRRLKIIKALKQEQKNQVDKIEIKHSQKITNQGSKQKQNNFQKTEKIQIDNAIEHENTIKINKLHQQISKFEQNNKKEPQNKQKPLRVQIPKQSNQFEGYQSPTNSSAQKYNQFFNKSPASDSSLFSKQSLFRQQKGKYSDLKNNENSEQQQLSYEEYRRSMIEINIANNQKQVQNNQNHQMQVQTQQQQNMSPIQHQNNISQDFQQNQLQQNLPYKTQANKSHKLEQEYEQGQQEQQQQSQHNNLWQQYLNNNNDEQDEQDITNQKSQSSIQFNEQYIDNKYNENLCKKVFKYWKNQVLISHNQSEISRNNLPQQKSIDLLYRAWQGLRIYARQKRLAKKYLKQYEQQLHYYPHSQQEYLEFKKIAQI